MMYQHTMTVYDRGGALVKTIPDSVDLAQFGIAGHPGISRGAPVEAAVDAAHKYMFATNYSMYGANFGPEGSDNCGGPGGLSPSYVYRVSLKTLAIDKVGQVGMVPKYVAVTPDDKYVLVTQLVQLRPQHPRLQHAARGAAHPPRRVPAWDRSRRREARRLRRGDGLLRHRPHRSANVRRSRTSAASATPRATSCSRNDGSRLFVTLNGDNRVVAVDTATGQVVARTTTGSQPRSMAISSDGRALYVVNYASNTVSVLKASDLSIVRTFPVATIRSESRTNRRTHRVWVACYSGEILVYNA